MARPPETDAYPEEIEADREIKPLTSDGGRLPTIFIVIAAVGGLLLLLLLQIFDGDDTVDQTAPTEVFAPAIDPNALLIPEPVTPPPPPAPVIEEEDDFPDEDDAMEFNLLEVERLRQLALLEEQRAQLIAQQEEARAAERRRRISSGMLIVDNGGTAPTTDDAASFEESVGPGFEDPFAEPDENERNEIITNRSERFLRDASVLEVVSANALKLTDQDHLITQGTFISGVTETMINSDLPGLIRAVVDKDVYSRTGRNIVIPRGSRLIGRYQSGIDVGQARVYIVWTRMERPDGVIAELGSPGTDPIGQAGMGGDVDKHFIERFGASVLFSTIGPAVSAVIGTDADSAVEQDLLISTRESTDRVAEIALQQSINIPPTIRVPQGSEITIFVNRDISFANLD